jgi:hypothetical protein
MGAFTRSNTLATVRDHRIDFWRGLCLIDMVLVHLYYENVQMGQWVGKILGEYTRFAAGGFVFVAGLSIGAIFLPRARNPEQRMPTYRRLWARSLRILGWQYIVAITWVDLLVWRGTHGAVEGMGKLLLDVVTFKEGGDLLPLYVLLIALAPLLLEVRRRTWGLAILAPLSIAVFIFGRFHPYALSVDPQGNFPPLLWQLVFISGLVAGSFLKRYDCLSLRTKVAVCGAAWVLFALMFWCEWWTELGLPACPFRPLFAKVPLTTAELFRYFGLILGLITGTDLAWKWLAHTAVASFAATLGRSALPVYVAHTFLIEFSGWLAVSWWSLGAWQILFVPVCLGLLWLLATALQWRRRQPEPVLEWTAARAAPTVR